MSEDSVVARFSRRYELDETRFGVQRKPTQSLPMVDVGAVVHGGTTAEVDACATAVRDACINSGFFYITNYGISDNEMQNVAAKAIEFFHLPSEVKMTAHSNDFSKGRGYQPMASERITPGYEPDFKEYYDIGLDIEDERLNATDRGKTIWPEEEVLPGYRETMSTHARRTAEIGRRIIRAFARALGLAEDFFDEAHAPPFFNFRPSYYPPAKGVLKRNLWSCGPHTDYMSLTMLWQDEVGGLEVMNLNGEWIDAPPRPETMILNVADMMSIWTNDLFTSNPHRVANRTPGHRVSLAHFIGPGSNTTVRCLPTCQGADNPPRYEATTTAQHVANIMAQSLSPELVRNVRLERSEVTEQLRQHDRIGAG